MRFVVVFHPVPIVCFFVYPIHKLVDPDTSNQQPAPRRRSPQLRHNSVTTAAAAPFSPDLELADWGPLASRPTASCPAVGVGRASSQRRKDKNKTRNKERAERQRKRQKREEREKTGDIIGRAESSRLVGQVKGVATTCVLACRVLVRS